MLTIPRIIVTSLYKNLKRRIVINKFRILFTLVCSIIISYSSISAKTDLQDISKWFKGNYSTTEQANKDSTIIDLSLKVAQFSIQDTPGNWAYLETAFSNDKDNPYRQEVYHFSITSFGLINLDIYTIKNSASYVGACDNDSLLNRLTLEMLEQKSNCSIIITKTDNIYIGSTAGKNCPSTLRGAKYETTELEITKVDFFLWERGYDARSTQVWGSSTTGYIFKKEK